MAEARSGAGPKRAGRTDADENGGRAIDDETHAVQRVAEGDEEEMTPDSLAEVGMRRADGSERPARAPAIAVSSEKVKLRP